MHRALKDEQESDSWRRPGKRPFPQRNQCVKMHDFQSSIASIPGWLGLVVLRLSFAGLNHRLSLNCCFDMLSIQLYGLNLCKTQFTTCKMGMIKITCQGFVRTLIYVRHRAQQLSQDEQSINISYYNYEPGKQSGSLNTIPFSWSATRNTFHFSGVLFLKRTKVQGAVVIYFHLGSKPRLSPKIPILAIVSHRLWVVSPSLNTPRSTSCSFHSRRKILHLLCFIYFNTSSRLPRRSLPLL